MPDTLEKPSGDFDFLIGSWQVRHRRLKRRLAECDSWVEFEGSCVARKILGGFANIDEFTIDLPGDPYIGVTLRTFDPLTRQWTIYWLDSRQPGRVDTPVIGRFANGAGTFYAEDVFERRPIRIRFIWSRVTGESCRWEQAFSADGGKRWETNWVRDFARV